jgi:pimeloyl-ACP methyl ester carboxylesterase
MTAVRLASLVGFVALVVTSPVSTQEPIWSPRVVQMGANAVRVLTVGLDGRTSGEPVFVLQAGAGTPLDAWDYRFVREIASWAPVVAYDRPGLGGSRFDGHEPTFDRVADHLNSLLAVLAVDPPYILIGHSWGGPLILHHAARYPHDVVGLVYVDPSNPHRDLELPTDPAGRASALAALDSARALSRLMPAGRGAESRVLMGYWSTLPQERAIPPNLAVPTAVVLGTYVGAPVPLSERPAREAFHRQRVEGIRRWFGDVRQLHWIVAPHAGHFVQEDDPALVAAAVRQVLDWVEAGF